MHLPSSTRHRGQHKPQRSCAQGHRLMCGPVAPCPRRPAACNLSLRSPRGPGAALRCAFAPVFSPARLGETLLRESSLRETQRELSHTVAPFLYSGNAPLKGNDPAATAAASGGWGGHRSKVAVGAGTCCGHLWTGRDARALEVVVALVARGSNNGGKGSWHSPCHPGVVANGAGTS